MYCNSVLDIASLFAMYFNHGKVRLQHSPFIGDSFLKIRFMSSEAYSFVVIIDEIHKNIRKILIFVEFDGIAEFCEPSYKSESIFLQFSYCFL